MTTLATTVRPNADRRRAPASSGKPDRPLAAVLASHPDLALPKDPAVRPTDEQFARAAQGPGE